MIWFGRTFGELIRFAITGTLCVALNIAIVAVFTEYLHLHYLLSVAICFLLVTLVGFLFNRYWTFRRRGGRPIDDYGRYLFIAILNLLLSVGLVGLFVDVLRIPYPVAMALLSLAFVPVTFVLHRSWTFRTSRHDDAVVSGRRYPP